MNTRAKASKLITKVVTKGNSLTDLLMAFKNHPYDEKDKAFFQALSFGVIRWYPRLAFIANKLLKKPLKDKDLLHLIYIGLFQLMAMQTPDYAAIKETVEAARHLQKPWGANLVNALLRSYQRQSESLNETLKENDEAFFAHPKWWIDEIQKAWPNDWKMILEANNQLPPLILRVNKQKISRSLFLEKLATNNLSAIALEHTPHGVQLIDPVPITTLPGYQEGFFSVQDGASQLICQQLALSDNHRILDACAAPGGKTALILEEYPSISLTALDISQSRTQMIQANLQRLGLKGSVLVADATKPSTWWDKKPFDRILLDAPCSGSGVIRRHPDIKLLRKKEDITALRSRQLACLNALWPLLAPGGRLLYTTCSIFPDENDQLIQDFISKQSDALVYHLNIPIGFKQKTGHQILPGQSTMDGFFYACLTKAL